MDLWDELVEAYEQMRRAADARYGEVPGRLETEQADADATRALEHQLEATTALIDLLKSGALVAGRLSSELAPSCRSHRRCLKPTARVSIFLRALQFFAEAPARIRGNRNLRIPQIDGHAAAIKHFSVSQEHAIEQIPVGCGKSGLVAILPFGLASGRVLVIVPNLEIRRLPPWTYRAWTASTGGPVCSMAQPCSADLFAQS